MRETDENREKSAPLSRLSWPFPPRDPVFAIQRFSHRSNHRDRTCRGAASIGAATVGKAKSLWRASDREMRETDENREKSAPLSRFSRPFPLRDPSLSRSSAFLTGAITVTEPTRGGPHQLMRQRLERQRACEGIWIARYAKRTKIVEEAHPLSRFSRPFLLSRSKSFAVKSFAIQRFSHRSNHRDRTCPQRAA